MRSGHDILRCHGLVCRAMKRVIRRHVSGDGRSRPRWSRLGVGIAVALLLAPPTSLAATAGQSAATLYALNCMGCHFPPEDTRRQAPFLVGQFAHSESGRVFFIRVPDTGGKPLDKEQDALLLREILSWKKSCPVIIQDASLLKYTGAR